MTEWIFVQGTISTAGDATIAESFLTDGEESPVAQTGQGTHALTAVSATGKVLAESAFSVSFQNEDQPIPFMEAPFAAACVFPDEAIGVEVLSEGKVVATLTRPAAPSHISDFHVEPSTSDDGRPALAMKWAAVGGTPLTYSLSYSTDQGASFRPWQSGITDTSRTIPVDGMAGGDDVLIKVTASDGFALSEAMSSPVPIERGAPVAVILSPPDGTQFVQDEQLVLRGAALDPQDGVLGDSSLEWLLGSDGQKEVSLGYGAEVAIKPFPPGKHLVRLRATGSAGLLGWDERTVVIS